jgi:uncharacterized membrane-anchored protein YhcB (DUF1043 family)
MAEINAELVEHRLKTQQEKIEKLEIELRDFKKDTEEDFAETNEKVNKLATSQGRIELMLSNVSEKIDKIAESAGKDQGWRALVTDIVKVVLLILGFFATGKFFF